MGYQALLFCPDDKIARTVTQVLSELEFAVEPCIEPFAAVKKLMAEHFDAVVVDCDNDQNASLLFKSARNSTVNQAALAVAVVEGQAGVAKAFRIGANLVLTKPINVEQAKGTLRVARGLLRKGEGAKPATPAGAPAPASTPTSVAPASVTAPPAAKPVRPVPAAPAKPATLAAATAKARTVAPPVAKAAPVASARVITQNPQDQSPKDQKVAPVAASTASPSAQPLTVSAAIPPAAAQPAAKPVASDSTTASTVSSAPGHSVSSGAAAAPAREAATPVVEQHPSPSIPAEPEKISSPASAPAAESQPHESASAAPAPSFTFGGANLPETSAAGGNKKVFLAVAAVIFLLLAGYYGWTQLHSVAPHPTASTPASPVPVKVPAAAQPAGTQSSVAATPATSASSGASPDSPVNDIVLSTTDAASGDSGKNGASAATSKPTDSSSSINPATKTAPGSKPAAPPSAPIVLKNGAIKSSAKAAAADAAAPSMDGMATAGGDSSLSNLTATGPAAKPVLQTVNVSQGVSQGLLLKKVQPAYPPTALRMRTEGAVKLMATIGKTGNVTEVKVLTGEPLLAQAAVEAVKQWKYKPYLLNGDPVEIQTEVTINFKLPN